MKYDFKIKMMKNLFLSICLSFFIESYVLLVENNYLISNFSPSIIFNVCPASKYTLDVEDNLFSGVEDE